MSKKVNTGRNPFAFERIAHELWESESNRQFAEMIDFLDRQPDGPVPGLSFSFRASANSANASMLDNSLGHPVRRPFKTALKDEHGEGDLTTWRADVLAERVDDDDEPHYRLHISNVVVGDEMLDWEVRDIGIQVAKEVMRDRGWNEDEPHFLFGDTDGNLASVVCLRSLAATADQFRMGLRVSMEKGGKLDMGQMHLAWSVTVDTYNFTVLSSYLDGVDEPPDDTDY